MLILTETLALTLTLNTNLNPKCNLTVNTKYSCVYNAFVHLS